MELSYEALNVLKSLHATGKQCVIRVLSRRLLQKHSKHSGKKLQQKTNTPNSFQYIFESGKYYFLA
jgi:hypothetical protein